MNSVLYLPDGQVKSFGDSNNRRTVINPAHPIFFGGGAGGGVGGRAERWRG